MNTQDPLAKLIQSDSEEADRQKLAELLAPYVVLDEKSHKVNLKDKFFELGNNIDKIEMVLLGEKARSLFFKESSEGISPANLIALEIMPEGSVKSSLKILSDRRKILKNLEGKYYIPNYRVKELFAKFVEVRK